MADTWEFTAPRKDIGCRILPWSHPGPLFGEKKLTMWRLHSLIKILQRHSFYNPTTKYVDKAHVDMNYSNISKIYYGKKINHTMWRTVTAINVTCGQEAKNHSHDDVVKCKSLPYCLPLGKAIHWSAVDFPEMVCYTFFALVIINNSLNN